MKKAKIYKPSKTAMQSGLKKFDKWIIEFITEDPGKNPLMGWESSSDTYSELNLEFKSKDLAIEYAKKNNILFMVDNTIATPILFNPIDYGADIVLHSVTKFMGGHGVALGGAIVDSGNFDWAATKKFKNITESYSGYDSINSVSYTHLTLPTMLMV